MEAEQNPDSSVAMGMSCKAIWTVNDENCKAKTKRAARSDGKFCHPVVVAILVVLPMLSVPVAAISLNTTKQILPKECLSLFEEHHNSCPDKAVIIFVPLWNDLNKLCCDSYAGTLHCQMNEEGGQTYSMLACVPGQTVPVGKVGKLVKNGTGYPELDLDLDCPAGTFRDYTTDSTLVLYQYCDAKTKGEPEEEMWCDGGPSADDLFVCRRGYYADNCPYGHNSHDSCICLLLRCGEGLESFQNVTGSCSSNNIHVTYGCTAALSTLGTTLSTGTDGTTSSTSSGNQTKAIIGHVLGTVAMAAIFVTSRLLVP